MNAPADRLRAAADRLSSPTLCNTNPWDAAVAAWLRKAAADVGDQLDIWGYHVGHCGWHIKGDVAGGPRTCTCWDPALAVADAVLAATGGAS